MCRTNIAMTPVLNATIMTIGIFSILWCAFEKEKCGNNCDMGKLERLAQDYRPSQQWTDFATQLNNRAKTKNRTIQEYVNNDVALGRGLCLCQKQEIIGFMQSNGTQNIYGGLLAIYRIRNNMFHGLKDLQDLDNQQPLFDSMNNLLESLL